uniref:Xylem serine proteinase 1 n=1 Tax=Solanum tuberosum TaxID=4113 RepID=M1DL82_SOLTU
MLEVAALKNSQGILSVRPRKNFHPQTTHTTIFLGLQQSNGSSGSLWENSNYGKGMIIGVVDTGIMPDHPSFHDEGMPPPSARWKGKCEFYSRSSCNNKLIGARYFHESGNGTPLDENGHGTHTSSIAAGNFVNGVNVLGMANGTASGMAPLAHVAMYKVCSSIGCPETDVLAAIDAAIEDGADVL